MSKPPKVTSYRNRQFTELPGVVAAPLTTVVNITTHTGGKWRYIGRDWPAKGFKASRWANSFKIDVDTPEARRASAKSYAMQLHSSGLFYHVAELRGQDLGCFCAPKLCHGHVLAALANALQHHGGACPNCRNPVKSSPAKRAASDQYAEYWRCPTCGCWGFHDLGTLQLFPE